MPNKVVFKEEIFKQVIPFICKQYNITVYDMDIKQDWRGRNPEDFKNKSCIYGNDEIILGVYDDEELKAISFFHEFGHTLVTDYFMRKINYNKLMIELEAWNLGVAFALNFSGIIFSDKALKWGYEQALTYVGHDEREVLGWKFYRQASYTPKLDNM